MKTGKKPTNFLGNIPISPITKPCYPLLTSSGFMSMHANSAVGIGTMHRQTIAFEGTIFVKKIRMDG